MEDLSVKGKPTRSKAPRTPWTEEELRELQTLYLKGYSLREISNVLGRSLDSVKGVIKRANFRKGTQRSRDRKSGFLTLGVKGALRKLGLPESEIKRICRELGEHAARRKYFSSSNFFLSDAEAAMVVYRYLQMEKDVEGATRLWREHIKYRDLRNEVVLRGGSRTRANRDRYDGTS